LSRDYCTAFPGPDGEQRPRVPELFMINASSAMFRVRLKAGKHPKDTDWTLLEDFHPAEQPVLKEEMHCRRLPLVALPRMGTNPLRKKTKLTEERRAHLREMAKVRFGRRKTLTRSPFS
jgi:hypothetical protein